MSLRWRIALSLAVLAAAVGALAATGSYVTTSRQLRAAIDDSLSAQVSEVGDGPESGRPGAVDDAGCPPDALLQPAAAAQVVRDDGSIAVCLPRGPLLPAPETDPRGDQVVLSTVEAEGGSYRVAASVFHAGGVLQIARDEREITDVLDALQRRLLLLTGVVGIGAGVAGWLLARRLVRPVLRLRDTARAIAASQDLTTPVAVDGSGELRDLALSFNSMVDALAASRAQQRRLVDDASHEMRTPLTSLTTNLELLERFTDLPEEERPEVLAAVRTDVDELTHLMTELVELTTDRSSEEPVVPVDLADLAASVAARSRRRNGRTIELSIDGEGTVPARAQMVERAIGNLVDNAVKYSPPASVIEIHVRPDSIEVRDQGDGIPEAEQDRVFERFYRSDATRTSPGSGLGLAIVHQIVERHGGRVWARTGPQGGARVGFQLPTSEDPRPESGPRPARSEP